VAFHRQRLDLVAQPFQVQRLAMSSAARSSGMRARRTASSAGRPRPSHFSWLDSKSPLPVGVSASGSALRSALTWAL
jgi:hypothetical protein